MTKTAYVIDALRTPVGRFGGSLATVRPDDLAAHVIKALMQKHPEIDWNDIEDVIFGAANQAGEDNRNVARMASLLAGLPVSVSGVTVNRLCASGLQAIMDAAKGIMLGMGDLYIAGGVESMTRAPFVMAKANSPFERNVEIYDTSIGWRFINKKLSAMYYPFTMGETAENLVDKYGISRNEQDLFAHLSQLKYDQAHKGGRFDDEIVKVNIERPKMEDLVFEKDEHPRLGSVEKLAALSPAFKKGGSVTAGNSSGINDGAAALLIASEEAVKRYNLKPLAAIRSMASAGVPPEIMGIGPVPATQKALLRAGLNINDINLIELNEAFASQAIACMRELDLNPELINVNGGSIAIGHPLGASGARISTTLIHQMQKSNSQYGLATMCIGVGQGMALVYEKV
jgi:3-oxoadipyl-CoA thiolase